MLPICFLNSTNLFLEFTNSLIQSFEFVHWILRICFLEPTNSLFRSHNFILLVSRIFFFILKICPWKRFPWKSFPWLLWICSFDLSNLFFIFYEFDLHILLICSLDVTNLSFRFYEFVFSVYEFVNLFFRFFSS